MNNSNKKLYLEQVNQKMKPFFVLKNINLPPCGWIYAIRNALGMSLKQLGKRLRMTPQSVKAMEIREKSKSITLKSLEDFAQALDMKLVYGFIPKKKSLAGMLDMQAEQVAQKIVFESSKTMHLEKQENLKLRLRRAVKERKQETLNKITRNLWD